LKPIRIPKEQKERIVEELQYFVEAEWSHPVGQLAAEQLLDVMIKELAPILYNQAVNDARQLLMERMAGLEDDLYSLEMPAMKERRR
jgi:uncharacterized protein (DUF2164 family)